MAGKRVALQWVRRTLICERLEDCQRECGDEKRFSCEGFNYRLDPSGRGQGECELVEVPLSRMDLYSSPHNRDSNLISHTDYDYYERDRSSTNCRANPCVDCGSNPAYGKPQRPPPSYKPSYETDRDRDRYRPDTTAIDKYRPQNHFYETRPDSWDRYGGSNYYASSGDQGYNRPPSNSPESRPPYGHGGFSIDRYGTEETSGGSDYFRPQPSRPIGPPSYIDSPDSGYRPEKPFARPPLRPIGPDSDSGYNRPSDSGYIRPPSDSGHIRPPLDSGYNRPPSESVYDRPPSDSGYNRPSDSGYNRPPSDSSFNRPPSDSSYNRPPSDSSYNRPLPVAPLPQKPSDYDRPDPPYRPGLKPESTQQSGGYGGHHEPPQSLPSRPGYSDRDPPQSPPPRPGYLDRDPPHSLPSRPGYLDRDPPSSYHRQPDYHPTNFHQKPAGFVPYLIGQDNSWGMYGGTYGSSQGSVSYRPQIDYWGLKNEIKRKDGPNFNYYELGPVEDNNVHQRYGGAMSHGDRPHQPPHYQQHGSEMNWGQMWTRRPSSEGEFIFN